MNRIPEWPKHRLDDICEQITDGKHGDCKEQPGSGFYFLSAKDVVDGQLLYDNARQITEADFVETHKRTRFEPLDILFTNSGTIGRMALAPDIERTRRTTFQKSVAILKPKRSVVEPRFLYYLLLADNERLVAFAGGTAQKNLLLRDLRAFPVELPPIGVQKRIVFALSAYDDLIENNTRRIKILEQMAQMVYREWFVDFRFPGHEKVKVVEFEGRRVPEGWKAGILRDVCKSIDYGYTASAVREAVGPRFLRITDIVPESIDWDSVPFCAPPEKRIENYLLGEGDIVVARTGATTGYAKRIHKRHPVSIFASYLVRLRIGEEHSNAAFGLLVESDNYKRFIKANIGGAAQPQANAQVLTSIPVVIPPQMLQSDFSAIVEPFLDEKEILQLKNLNLRRTRDLLLPKVISGEISIKDVQTETAAQVV